MFVTSFLQSESGAVTVDWVVLTAAVMGFGLAAAFLVLGGVESLTDEVGAEIASIQAGFSFDPDAPADTD